MKRHFFTRLLLLCLLGAILPGLPVPSHGQGNTETDELRKMILEIKENYESRIDQLESRVDELEKSETALKSDLAEARKESQAANETARRAAASAATAPPIDGAGLPSSSKAPVGDTASFGNVVYHHELEEILDEKSITTGLEFHGYFRSGYGISDTGDVMEAFQAPGAQSKFRLGNETETYLETAFLYNFPELALDDGTEFMVGIRPAYVISDARSSAETELTLREAYGAARGVWADRPEAQFWAGQRFYDRYDVHMTDFYYLDMSGFGGGVEDIDIGWGKLSVAWLGGSIDTVNSNASAPSESINAKNSLDFRIDQIELNDGVEGLLWLDVAKSRSRDFPNGENIRIKGSTGAAGAMGIKHDNPFDLGGRNIAMVQFGTGGAANFRSTAEDFSFLGAPDAPAPATFVDLSDAWHFRFVEDLVIEPNEALSLQMTFVWDEFEDGVEGGALSSRSSWQSFGIRPEWNITNHFGIAFEGAVDNVSVLDNPSGQLAKFTVAPQIKSGRGYFDRPTLRAFATYAVWSDDLQGFVAPRTHFLDTSGWSFGVQVEAWW